MDDLILSHINKLIQSILKIPGKKKVTLAFGNRETFVIDISENGDFGYEEGHELLFRAKLQTAFTSQGGLVIREFLPVKVEEVMPNGKTLWKPIKNIYGVHIQNGKWCSILADELQDICNTDADTGELLPPEDNVHYVEFPFSLASD